MGRRSTETDGVMLHDEERQDFMLFVFLFSIPRKLVLNLEMLNKYLEKKIGSGRQI